MTTQQPEIIAHRGFAGVAPENTLAAFRAVADGRHPASMVELDVVPCGDGTPVVFHDSRLDDGGRSRGITDREGRIWETPCEDVLDARVLGTDETIPTLDEALSVLLSDVGVNVELKNPGAQDLQPETALASSDLEPRRETWEPFVERVGAVLDRHDGEVLLSSFYEPAIAAASGLLPEYPLAPLFGTATGDGLVIAERYDCEAIHPSLELIPGTPYYAGDPELAVSEDRRPGSAGQESAVSEILAEGGDLFDAAAALGVDINVWTVETWHQADWLEAVGVDGVIADYPGVLAYGAGDFS